MRRLTQWTAAVSGVLALGVLVAFVWPRQSLPPSPIVAPAEELVELERYEALTSIPDASVPPSAAQQLEARLAALAQDVERRRDLSPDPGLIEFDVEGLAATLTEMVERYEDRADVSVHVRDLESGHVLFDYFGDAPLIPASNQKIVTTAAALDLLGPDYVFTTEVSLEGNTLNLIGGGDPVLDADDLAAIAGLVAQQVDVAGVQRLVIDDSAFSSRRLGPGYAKDGPGHAYQAPSGALSLTFNTVEVTVYPVAGVARLGVSVVPESAHVRVENRARTGSRNTLAVRTYARGDQTVVRIDGRMPRKGGPVVFRRRVTDPGLYTGAALAAMLAELSQSEPLAVSRGVVSPDAEVLVTNESAPLIEVLDSGMAYSNNFIAEQTMRTLAWRMTGDPGDWNAGQQILHDYWEALTGPEPGVVVVNASGLSRQGRLTTSGLVDLIAVAHRTESSDGSLIDALPVAGEPGTLRSRLRLSGKRVRAKTGTLDRVSGLSGVITSEAGEPQLGFSILTNAAPRSRMVAGERRALEDRIVMAVLRTLDGFEAERSGLGGPG